MVPLYSSKITRVPLYSRKLISITSKGLSPAVVSLSRLFKLTYQLYWPVPLSLATTNGVSIDFFSSGYLDVSVLRVCAGRPKPGYPIRKSMPQRSFAPQHSLSQLITSFIAIKSQGIRQLLLVAYENFYSTNMSKNFSVENIGVEPMTS